MKIRYLAAVALPLTAVLGWVIHQRFRKPRYKNLVELMMAESKNIVRGH